jgi:hypothetical protein
LQQPAGLAQPQKEAGWPSSGKENRDGRYSGPPHLCTERASANLLRTHRPKRRTVALRASVGSTEAPEKDVGGSIRFYTLVTLDL